MAVTEAMEPMICAPLHKTSNNQRAQQQSCAEEHDQRPGLLHPADTRLGFVDREGGDFFQEWSGLFVMQGEQGERVLFYYPRLQATGGAEEAATALIAPIERIALSATFRSLPVTDANDGQQTVCFRSFLPSALTLI